MWKFADAQFHTANVMQRQGPFWLELGLGLGGHERNK